MLYEMKGESRFLYVTETESETEDAAKKEKTKEKKGS